MRRRSPCRTSVSGQRGVGTTEYVVLIVLAGLAALSLYAQFGRSVGGKVDVAGKRVEALGQDRAATVGGAAGVGGSGREGDSGAAAGGGAAAASAEVLPEPIDGSNQTAGGGVDTRMIVLLGILVVAVGALMILAVAQRVRKDKKKAKAAR